MSTSTYTVQCARDAQAYGYGDESYWQMLEDSSIRTRDYYLAQGDTENAAKMLTRSLSEALEGNDGD